MAETRKEALDRELQELLEEIRVVLPGVQFLGALLLTVAFTDRFEEFTDPQRRIYYTGLLSSLVAAILLLSPTAQHRLLWRQPKKELLLRTATVLAFLATPFIAVAMGCVAFLMGSVVFDSTVAAWSLAITAAPMLIAWYAWPLWLRLFGRPDPEE